MQRSGIRVNLSSSLRDAFAICSLERRTRVFRVVDLLSEQAPLSRDQSRTGFPLATSRPTHDATLHRNHASFRTQLWMLEMPLRHLLKRVRNRQQLALAEKAAEERERHRSAILAEPVRQDHRGVAR